MYMPFTAFPLCKHTIIPLISQYDLCMFFQFFIDIPIPIVYS